MVCKETKKSVKAKLLTLWPIAKSHAFWKMHKIEQINGAYNHDSFKTVWLKGLWRMQMFKFSQKMTKKFTYTEQW